MSDEPVRGALGGRQQLPVSGVSIRRRKSVNRPCLTARPSGAVWVTLPCDCALELSGDGIEERDVGSASIRSHMNPRRRDCMWFCDLPPAFITPFGCAEKELQVHQVVDDYRELPILSRIRPAVRVPRLNRADLRVVARRKWLRRLYGYAPVSCVSGEQVSVAEAREYHEAKIVRCRDGFCRLDSARPLFRKLPHVRSPIRLIHVPEETGKETARPLIVWTLHPLAAGVGESRKSSLRVQSLGTPPQTDPRERECVWKERIRRGERSDGDARVEEDLSWKSAVWLCGQCSGIREGRITEYRARSS